MTAIAVVTAIVRNTLVLVGSCMYEAEDSNWDFSEMSSIGLRLEFKL